MYKSKIKIIIDGNDGVGKTTLAKKLQKDLGLKSYIHLSGNDPRDYDFYSNIFKKQDVIFDRSFISEIIYSVVLKRKCALSKKEYKKLHKLISKDAIVIIAKSSQKLYDLSENKNIIEESKKIDKFFDNVAHTYNYCLFDTREDDYEHLLNSIKEAYEELHRAR